MMCKVIEDDALVLDKKHIQDEFRKWLKNKHSEWTDSTVDMHRSDAFFLYNNDIGVTLGEALNDNDGEQKAYNAIKAHFVNKGYERSDSRAEGYLRSLRFLKEFLTDKDKSKTKNNEINKHINKIEQPSKNKPKSVISIKKPLSASSHEIVKRIKITISKENAKKYYSELINVHKTEIDLAYKVPIYKKIMENEILKEVTGISHYKDIYEKKENGQRKWLIDNIEKRNKNGDILSGSVPKEKVSGIQNLFDWRDIAEHENKMLNSTYLGLFTTVAQTISFFSKTDIPREIMDICNGETTKDNLTTPKPIKPPKNRALYILGDKK